MIYLALQRKRDDLTTSKIPPCFPVTERSRTLLGKQASKSVCLRHAVCERKEVLPQELTLIHLTVVQRHLFFLSLSINIE
jgi:hypothetical protein